MKMKNNLILPFIFFCICQFMAPNAFPKPSEYISVMTFNIWRDEPLDYGTELYNTHQKLKHGQYNRIQAIQALFNKYQQTDIFAIQELSPRMYSLVTTSLPNHAYLSDINSERNIFWDQSKLQLESKQQVYIDANNNEDIVMARLKVKSTSQSIVVVNIHLTWWGNKLEINYGKSPRVKQSRKLIDEINNFAGADEVVIICGDINDSVQPIKIFFENNYKNAFYDLGLVAASTHPTPIVNVQSDFSHHGSRTYDWIFSKNSQAISAQVVHFHENGIYPSDHFPVLAIYKLLE
jgi:endonuclease/exonuclease/phosphatase family metal-dependent hydrolase